MIERTDLTTADVAIRLTCSAYKVRSLAKHLGIGINLGGRAGYRFTEAEYEALRESMRVRPNPAPQRHRNRGRGRVA